MAFRKGESGNPNGARVKSQEQRDFEKKCKEWCRDYAFDKLKRIADREDDKRSDWAIEHLLNRAFGKPIETSVIDAAITAEVGSGIEELTGTIASLVPSAEGEGGAHPGPDKVDSGK